MDALKIAGARSLTADNPEAFLLAFNAGLHAAELDVDSARFLRSLLVDGHASSAAGFLEGLAAANAAAGLPTECADPFWKRNQLGRRVTA
ncbi:hypothetical protein ABZX65_27170 [Streptomyces sp. NPDC003300]|uniref:hypothetical protein n=1 Tax=unclassified Streptomyces TaxID=2593676 RepID=UPI0033A6C935